MYKIFFYKNKNGTEPVLEYLKKLRESKSKDSRIKLNKINDYIRILSEYGTSAGKPYIDHIDGEIWEIRPIRDRILFVTWENNSFILLHCFMKKTQKTPKKEIDQAKKNLADLKERGVNYE